MTFLHPMTDFGLNLKKSHAADKKHFLNNFNSLNIFVISAAKPIPIMLLGVLIGRKTYTAYKYIFVLIIVFGVMLFSFKEKYDKKDGEDPILGIIFIGVSLLMDGFLGAFEDRMRSVKKPTSLNFMLFLNSWNSLYLITYLIFTDEGVEFFKFCQRHPDVLRDLSIVTFVGIFGQFCITAMVANFGALPLSITTTIRKFVTVLLSVMIYNNVLSVRQWIAATIIFSSIFLDGYFSRRGAAKKTIDETMVKNGKEEPGKIEAARSETDAGNLDIFQIKSALAHKNEAEKEKCCKKRVRISISEDDNPTGDGNIENGCNGTKSAGNYQQNEVDTVDINEKSCGPTEPVSNAPKIDINGLEHVNEKTDDTKL